MLISFISTKAQNTIEQLVIYKSFWHGGTTAMISSMFKDPIKYSIDTTNINIVKNMFLNEFNKILSETKSKKQYQQKITGINIAGEFWINSKCHFFIICEPNLLIDITNKKKYKITDKLILTQMQNWINSLR